MTDLIVNPPSDAFLAAVQALPPPGRAFPRDTDTLMAKVFTVPADAFAAVRAYALDLVNVEADPAATTQLLTDWETDWGLPDPCSVAGGTIQQRQNSLLAKIASLGGQSIAYYEAVALALGYVITITELGDFAWQINAPTITVSYFELGTGACGDYFWTVDNSELECRIRAIMPAHTVLTFMYS